MKNTFHVIFLFWAVIGIISCKKTVLSPPQSSSLTIVNLVAGVDTIVTDFSGAAKGESTIEFYRANQIAPYDYAEISGHTGATPLAIASLHDSLNPFFQQTLDIVPNGIYSLFLMGSALAPEYVFMQDSLPDIAISDSVIGVRFINLATGSVPVNFAIGTSAGDSVIAANLAYKGITSFFTLPARTGIDAYSFDIEDASGTVLTSYTLSDLSSFYFRCVTLVYYKDLAGTLRILVVDNF